MYLNYCRGLRFEEAPDYMYLRQLFRFPPKTIFKNYFPKTIFQKPSSKCISFKNYFHLLIGLSISGSCSAHWTTSTTTHSTGQCWSRRRQRAPPWEERSHLWRLLRCQALAEEGEVAPPSPLPSSIFLFIIIFFTIITVSALDHWQTFLSVITLFCFRARRFTSRNNRHKINAFFVKFHTEIFVKSQKTESLYNGPPSHSSKRRWTLETEKPWKKETSDSPST